MSRAAAATPPKDALVQADPAEERVIQALVEEMASIVGRGRHTAKLVSESGEEVEIPASAFRALQLVAEGMAQGQSIALIPRGKELTTQQAAEILRVSRPHVVSLIEKGELPHHMVGTHRRIKSEDVLAYKAARDRRRRESLDELTHLSEETEGGYE